MRWTLASILVVVLGAVGGWIAYGSYITGPALQPTPPAASLAAVFPPAPRPVGYERAVAYARQIGLSSVIVVRDGHLVLEFGETNRKISAHSVRKSVVGALYGIAVARGLIDVDRSLAELGFDDANPVLTAIEKSARLEDLLTARSGIYHASVRGPGDYPTPGSHAPGEAFYYNDWSFNALGGIFEALVGLSLGEAFDAWIAKPTGMVDFVPGDVRYEHGDESVFPAYRFWLTGRDMARFGQLYLDDGRWDGIAVVPREWIDASFVKHTDVPGGASYGYLWWIMPDGSYLATGTGGQKIRLFPASRTMIVTRVDTGDGLSRGIWWNFGKRVNNGETLELLARLFGPAD